MKVVLNLNYCRNAENKLFYCTAHCTPSACPLLRKTPHRDPNPARTQFISDFGHGVALDVENIQVMLEEFLLNECSNMNKGVAFGQFFEEAKSTITGQSQPLFDADDYDAFFNMLGQSSFSPWEVTEFA